MSSVSDLPVHAQVRHTLHLEHVSQRSNVNAGVGVCKCVHLCGADKACIYYTRAGVLDFDHFLGVLTIKAVRGTVAIKGVFDN